MVKVLFTAFALLLIALVISQSLRVFLFQKAVFVSEYSSATGRLNLAVSHGNVHWAKSLLEEKADPNERGLEGETLLMHVCSGKGNYEMAEVLLGGGADVNLRDEEGQTALIFACASRNAPLVELLLHYGARTDFKDWRGKTALDLAEGNNFKDISALLKSVNNP